MGFKPQQNSPDYPEEIVFPAGIASRRISVLL